MRRNPVAVLVILGIVVAAVSAQNDDRAALLRGIDAKRGPGFVDKTRLADRTPALDDRK
jgi:hypothetical protein